MEQLHPINRANILTLTSVLVLCITLLQARVSSSQTQSKLMTLETNRLSERITVQAVGRGSPWINLRDGVDLPTTYTGAAGLQQVLEQNLAAPLSLASADFDEDGVPDLVSGYAGPSGNILSLHRGNVDSIYPNSPEAQQRKANGTFISSPFLSPAYIFEVPEPPEFIGAGDFDADGHWDVVTAARGSNALYLLAGDGRGGFSKTTSIKLPGTVTTLATGEINRADGLTDVVVGIVGADGPQALVFEWPEGALRGKPELITLPAETTALALGQLDDSYEMDLAVAAGSELLIVHGRDRRLSLDDIRQAEVPDAAIEQVSFPFAISSIALGDFIWDMEHRTEIALLSEDGEVRAMSKAKSKNADEWLIEPLFTSGQRPATGDHLVRVKVSSWPTDDLVVSTTPIINSTSS